MKFSEFYKLLEEHGWRKDGGSRHEHYVHPDYDYFIPVGRHPSKEVPKGTLNKMLKDAGAAETEGAEKTEENISEEKTSSWMLTIPSDQTITYGEENSSVDVRTYITEVQNLENTTSIYVYATHTGTFVETSDSSKTIPFTFSCANSNREANVAFLVNENVMKVDNEERTDHWVAESATITITSEDWSAAEPGTYETDISYSSGLTN